MWVVLDAALAAAILVRLSGWYGGLSRVDRLRLGLRIWDFITLTLAILPLGLIHWAARRIERRRHAR